MFMATVIPTFTQLAPNSNKKVVFFTVSASASDTFTATSHFSSLDHVYAFRTAATGTIVTCTFSGVVVTLGSGPSSETVSGWLVGTG